MASSTAPARSGAPAEDALASGRDREGERAHRAARDRYLGQALDEVRSARPARPSRDVGRRSGARLRALGLLSALLGARSCSRRSWVSSVAAAPLVPGTQEPIGRRASVEARTPKRTETGSRPATPPRRAGPPQAAACAREKGAAGMDGAVAARVGMALASTAAAASPPEGGYSRSNAFEPRVVRHLAQLVHLDEDRVGDALFDAAPQPLRVGDEEVITDELAAIPDPLGEELPAIPVLLGHPVLDRYDRVAVDDALPMRRHLLGAQRPPLVLEDVGAVGIAVELARRRIERDEHLPARAYPAVSIAST